MMPAQCRSARALIGWSQFDLAKAAQIGVVSLRQFERGATEPRRATIAVIRRALETAGVIFIDGNGEGPGVRLKKKKS
jgi:transcriptional regulator with XRE-family HTH domain